MASKKLSEAEKAHLRKCIGAVKDAFNAGWEAGRKHEKEKRQKKGKR